MAEDNRGQENKKVFSVPVSITIANGQTSGNAAANINGTITRFVLTLPDLDTDTTAILTVDDSDGNEIYNSGAQSDNGTTPLAVEGDVCGQLTFTITCTTGQTGAKACSVLVYVREP